MEIRSERLKLKPLKKKDIEKSLKNLELFYKSNNLKSNEKKLSQLMVKIYNIKLINMQNNPQYFLFYTYWLIINDNTNDIIGRIGFKDIPNQLGEIEIGYGTHPNYRSKGFMTEALKAITNWGFNQSILPIKKIIAKTKKDNIPSQKVLIKAGYVYKKQLDKLYNFEIINKYNSI
ncbi:MAG: GNAT family N-acetyltransferase [Halanaerobiales bacterium]|nr:GNAT family N-acetyltransferase [Halanaerobiales bacterium]